MVSVSDGPILATHLVRSNAEGFLLPFSAAPERLRLLNGAIYLVRTTVFRVSETLFPARTLPFRMPSARSR